MTKKQKRDFHRFLREQFGTNTLILKSERQGYACIDLLDAFTRTGDRATLLRGLISMGISGPAVRWHLAHPGKRNCVW